MARGVINFNVINSLREAALLIHVCPEPITAETRSLPELFSEGSLWTRHSVQVPRIFCLWPWNNLFISFKNKTKQNNKKLWTEA